MSKKLCPYLKRTEIYSHICIELEHFSDCMGEKCPFHISDADNEFYCIRIENEYKARRAE